MSLSVDADAGQLAHQTAHFGAGLLAAGEDSYLCFNVSHSLKCPPVK